MVVPASRVPCLAVGNTRVLRKKILCNIHSGCPAETSVSYTNEKKRIHHPFAMVPSVYPAADQQTRAPHRSHLQRLFRIPRDQAVATCHPPEQDQTRRQTTEESCYVLHGVSYGRKGWIYYIHEAGPSATIFNIGPRLHPESCKKPRRLQT